MVGELTGKCRRACPVAGSDDGRPYQIEKPGGNAALWNMHISAVFAFAHLGDVPMPREITHRLLSSSPPVERANFQAL